MFYEKIYYFCCAFKCKPENNYVQKYFKRVFDVVLSVTALLILSPLLLVILVPLLFIGKYPLFLSKNG